jgi:four helix bundle protein
MTANRRLPTAEDKNRWSTVCRRWSFGKIMAYKFERLEVWQLALEYTDLIYVIAEQLPPSENFNLKSQIIRAATSIVLNIAEGSTSQSDAEQARFLGLAIRSLIETVACQHLINRRHYFKDPELLRNAYQFSEKLLPHQPTCQRHHHTGNHQRRQIARPQPIVSS